MAGSIDKIVEGGKLVQDQEQYFFIVNGLRNVEPFYCRRGNSSSSLQEDLYLADRAIDDHCSEQLTSNGLFGVKYVLSELAMNAWEHGISRGEGTQYTIALYLQGDKVFIHVTDNGNGFQISDVKDPTFSEKTLIQAHGDQDRLKERGRGIFTSISLYVDQMAYNGIGNGVVAIKNLGKK